jgi:predicted DNA-binding transcriptional regulator
MTQGSRNALDELGLETAAFKVLCYLSFKEAPLKPKDIAKDIDVRASTIRARLTELKKVGLVSATSDGYVSNLTPYDILMKLYRDIKEEFRG